MPTTTEIKGTIGWLRKHQAYSRDVMVLCNYIEQLQAVLDGIRPYDGRPESGPMVHGDWESIQELQTGQ